MATPLMIDSMTVEEKIEAMERLWQDLCQHQDVLPVHEWQKQILDECEQLASEGRASFIDWDQAKKDISRETS